MPTRRRSIRAHVVCSKESVPLISRDIWTVLPWSLVLLGCCGVMQMIPWECMERYSRCGTIYGRGKWWKAVKGSRRYVFRPKGSEPSGKYHARKVCRFDYIIKTSRGSFICKGSGKIPSMLFSHQFHHLNDVPQSPGRWDPTACDARRTQQSKFRNAISCQTQEAKTDVRVAA